MRAFAAVLFFSLTFLSFGCDNDVTGTDRYAVTADTVLDQSTGLMWERELWLPYTDQEYAVTRCDALSLGGFDNWRLPTIDELRSIITGCPATMPGGVCTVSDPGCLGESCRPAACWSCVDGKGPGASGYYCDTTIWSNCGDYLWTSSVYADDNTKVWMIWFYDASVGTLEKSFVDGKVRCVRKAE